MGRSDSNRGGGGGGGGAEHLARIHGTEEDKVNCPFYFKVGACVHGDTCSRQHNKPIFSQTILVPHMWANPNLTPEGQVREVNNPDAQEDFNNFYHEIFSEFSKFGEIEDLVVTENYGNHLVGNVYVRYTDEEYAQKALLATQGRYYAGRQLTCEYSPVNDFRDARCRQFVEKGCDRGPRCNFAHFMMPTKECLRYIEKEFNWRNPSDSSSRSDRRSRSRSNSRGRRRRSRSRDRDRERRRDKDRERDREREKDRDGDKEKEKKDRKDDRSRSRSRDRDRDRERDRSRDRRRDRDREREKEKDRGDRDRDREKEKEPESAAN